eukprot:g9376.t1
MTSVNGAAAPTPLPSETFPYQGRLLAMQQRKRHADHDALLLQNRINLLRKEEAKADDCRLQKQKNHAVEETARLNRIRIYHELATARRNGVAQVRQQKQQIRQDIISMRQDHVRENREKRSDIKQREEEARHARLEDRARLVEESRRSYEERVRREEDEIAAREQEVARMEQKELSLIQQLKSTQALQQRAYQELETALGDSRAMVAKPFPIEYPAGATKAR